MQHYLFVHFKEKRTPDGEQVYFGVSRDGFHWEAINNGQPVLWAMLNEKGVRDMAIVRADNGKFYIFATDLSLSYMFREHYKGQWSNIQRYGSNCLMMWESEDLLHWSREKAVPVKKPGTGCCWAPDITRDRKNGGYILHWSSPIPEKNMKMCIWFTRTMDFEHYDEPRILYEKEDSGVIDSCMVEENGKYYMWVKSDGNPAAVILLEADNITGPFTRRYEFDEEMSRLAGGSQSYEAPTACRLENGGYNLFLDFYGVRGKGQGYVSFWTDDIASGVFKRADADFSYPYGFKHGTVLAITEEEYNRIKAFDYDDESYNR